MYSNSPHKLGEINAELIQGWPNLGKTQFKVTSKHTKEYNCFAYAAGENDRWWSPLPDELYYWPPGVKQSEFIDAYIEAYGTLGFKQCGDGTLEDGYEKIAFYSLSDDKVTHVAKQLEDGLWSSKLGNLEDITHELSGLEGNFYGKAYIFMKRYRLGSEAI